MEKTLAEAKLLGEAAALNAHANAEKTFAEIGELYPALIPNEDKALYVRAREQYNTLREKSRSLTVTELITKLWFEEAYRFETLWNESSQVYESLFDLFFSLASEIDSEGKSLADFIEYLEDVMAREEKPDDKDIPGEGEGGVRILSIHKSKGLEFPVVFIFDCTHSGNFRRSTELLSHHETHGLILNIPQAEELSSGDAGSSGANYFRDIFAEEESLKDSAELRRLLYVAMTRAENRLFLTFTLPAQTKEEKKEWEAGDQEFTEETIRRRLDQLGEKPEGRDTFLKLLAGPLSNCPSSLCSLETITVLTRAEISSLAVSKLPQSQREAALAAESFYDQAEIIPPGKAGPLSLQASKLAQDSGAGSGFRHEEDELDVLIRKAGIGPMDFGRQVHAVLEGKLEQKPYLIIPELQYKTDVDNPPGRLAADALLSQANILADRFLASGLGRRCAASSRRESEFAIVSSAVTANGKALTISGQIDLLFEEAGEVVVVDFKTDKTENPDQHYGQLAAYYRAASDIFGKKTSVWIYYLRSGRAVNVTAEIEKLSLDELTDTAYKVLTTSL
jgi:ATP-dependent helicase/nuclease subunit A